MIDINCWQLKFTSCTYSESLLKKIGLQSDKLNRSVNILEIKKAIYYARKYHGSQKRQSGEPYYSHPLAVAELLVPYCFKTDIIVASILHDTIEDTLLTKDMLEYIFDDNIADKVENLTRVKFDRKISSAEIVERLWEQKKYDLLLIKLFDRLHNMQTIGAKSPEKIIKITEETISTFIIVALYLENPSIAEEITRLCFDKKAFITNSFLLNKKIFSRDNFNDNYQLPFLNFQNEIFHI